MTPRKPVHYTQNSVYIDHRKGESKAVVPGYPEAKYKERTKEKE